MFKDTKAFSGFSVDNADKATQFYGKTLGMEITPLEGMEQYGMQELHINGGHNIMIYQKATHTPATFTVLSFPVENIDETISQLNALGIEMIQYHDDQMPQDAKGVARGLATGQGPDIAWFADPAGNNLAVLQVK